MEPEHKQLRQTSIRLALLGTLIRPALKGCNYIVLRGSAEMRLGETYCFDEIDRGTNRKISIVWTGLKKCLGCIHETFDEWVRREMYKEELLLRTIDQGLAQEQDEIEAILREKRANIDENWAFSSQNKQMLEELLTFVRDNMIECSHLPPYKLIQYGICYLVIQRAARVNAWDLPIDTSAECLGARLYDLAYFSRYAVAVYGNCITYEMTSQKDIAKYAKLSDIEEFKLWSNTSEDEIIFTCLEASQFLPAHIVCLDRDTESIIVAIRGTYAMFDVITDLKCEYVDYKVRVDNNVIKGKVHSGMLLAARNVSLRIKSVVTHILKEHPNYRLCITGHSLGAGIGSMLALIWLSDPFLKDKNIQVFGISPPATLTSELNMVLKKFVISASFGNDIFAKLSIGSIRDIAQMNLFLQKKEDETNFTAGKVVKSIFTGPTAEKEYIDLYQEYKDFSKSLHYSRLVPPGYSFQVFDRAQHQEYTSAFEHENSYKFENKYVGVFLRPEYHQEIIFSKTLISDHSSIQIEKALELLMGIKRKKLLESDPEDIIGETETPELETLEDEEEIVKEDVENPYRA